MKELKIIKIEKIQSFSKRYDITVADNNNFFANNILVHNCENLVSKYEIMKQFSYYKTEKLEGTSAFFAIKDGQFRVAARTIEFKYPAPETPLDQLNVYWKVARKYDIENKLRNELSWHESEEFKNIAFQGEIVGESIQGNIYKLKGQAVYFYNAFNIDTQEYIEYETFLKMIEDMGLETVPILDCNYTLPENAIDLLLDADNTYSKLNPKQLVEGFVYVAKGKINQGTRITRSNFNRLSFKAKSRTYSINMNK